MRLNLAIAATLLLHPMHAQAEPAAEPVQVSICYDFGCKSRDSVTLNQEFSALFSRLFQPTANSPLEERRQIAAAIAYLERYVGKITGTSQDIGGNYDPEREYPGQMDCVDESTNATQYLKYMQKLGLLHWHHPVARRHRSLFLIDGHWTAVIEENESGQRYAVDSWYHDNGQPPEIQPLEDWLKRRRPTTIK
ncbi:MAG TPA: hypothetical protein ENJ35_05355 [Gammaproteobacteria bacterium]|nr:hypothetical protein [Gammaproteobacteria bacterium]